MKEICICAAVKVSNTLIIRGHRHGDCFKKIAEMATTKKEREGLVQGFITSKNRFVDRVEGRKIQDKAGIPSVNPEGYMPGTLFSEDLY